MNERYVQWFSVDDNDFETIKAILDYLDDFEAVSFHYEKGKYKCQFKNFTVKESVFKEDFPNAVILMPN